MVIEYVISTSFDGNEDSAAPGANPEFTVRITTRSARTDSTAALPFQARSLKELINAGIRLFPLCYLQLIFTKCRRTLQLSGNPLDRHC